MSVGDVFVLDEKQGKTVNRIDTTANWELANPVLALGEFGLEKLSGNFAGKCNLKVGDGVTAWNNLGYLIQVNAVTVCPYDVGDILITMNATNPEQRWPGTKWEVFAPGRVLIGAGTGKDTRGESITFKAGDTGGEYKHQLTTGELPYVDGSFPCNVVGWHAWFTKGYAYGCSFTGMTAIINGAERTISVDNGTNNSSDVYGYGFKFGNNETHNIIQPFQSVFTYKRIS